MKKIRGAGKLFRNFYFCPKRRVENKKKLKNKMCFDAKRKQKYHFSNLFLNQVLFIDKNSILWFSWENYLWGCTTSFY